MLRGFIIAVFFVLFGNSAYAEEQAIRYATRGELLYLTHCIDCHSAQIHWREKTLVTDKRSLLSEVHRWQGVLSLEWSTEDIEDVAQYLNNFYYKYPTKLGASE